MKTMKDGGKNWIDDPLARAKSPDEQVKALSHRKKVNGWASKYWHILLN